jgi:hypothetical protein
MLNGLVSSEALNESAVHATQFFAVATMAAAVLPFVLARTVEQRPRPSLTIPAPRIGDASEFPAFARR